MEQAIVEQRYGLATYVGFKRVWRCTDSFKATPTPTMTIRRIMGGRRVLLSRVAFTQGGSGTTPRAKPD